MTAHRLSPLVIGVFLAASLLGAVTTRAQDLWTAVVYVKSGDPVEDAETIAGLHRAVANLNAGGANVGGRNFKYALHIGENFEEAKWISLNRGYYSRVFLVAHGVCEDENANPVVWLERIRDRSPLETPFVTLETYFEFWVACGKDGRVWDTEDFGRGAAQFNGHQYGKMARTSGVSIYEGLPEGWTPLNGGRWETIEYEVQYTVFHPGGADVYLTIVTIHVWIPNDSQPIEHMAFRRTRSTQADGWGDACRIGSIVRPAGDILGA